MDKSFSRPFSIQLSNGNRPFRLAIFLLLVLISQPSMLLATWQADTDDLSATTKAKFTPEQLEFFEAKIRPVLIEHCYDCHGPDSERAGGLSVASRKDLLSGGDTGPAINPGDSQASLLIEALRHGERAQMPPDGKLPVEIQADFIRWVEEKAAWPSESDIASVVENDFDLDARRSEHWSWQPIVEQQIPTVEDGQWPNDDLDRFILQKLEANHLEPAQDADLNQWLRRVYFDLTGLPPNRNQWEAFQNTIAALPSKNDPDYRQQLEEIKANVVDELLASPAYGEHWGRHWLDLVRYAETHGHEFDHPILNPFEYRDYVIRAFNADVSYQRLVAEHVAGDLLPNARKNPESGFNESILGTSFWYLGEANHAPVDSLIDEAGRMDNQIDVLGKTFMGMTVACARCHDHKFDAISAADYHALAGIIQSTRRDVGVIDATGQWQKAFETGRELDTEFQSLLAKEEFTPPTWSAKFVEQLLKRIDQQRAAGKDETAVGLATETDFDTNRIARLADATLKYAANETVDAIQPENPAKHLVAFAQRPLGQDVATWWTSYVAKLKQELSESSHDDIQSTRLFSADDLEGSGWSSTGWAFAEINTTFGLSTLLLDNPVVSIDSRRWGKSLAGTYRSPTFQITADQLHLKIRGDKAKIRLVVDSYRMNQFSPLLFADFLSTESDDRWHWRTLKGDMGRYLGHNAFLEVIDEGPGGVALAEVWMGGKPVEGTPESLVTYFADANCTNLSELSELFAHTFSDANPLDNASETAKVTELENAEVIAWSDSRKLQFLRWLALVQTRSLVSSAPISEQWEELKTQWTDSSEKTMPLRTLYVATSGTPEDQAIYVRGNTKNLGEIVPRGNLEAFHFEPDKELLEADPTGRLQLAHQIASPSNPLTARVFVNRVWHWLMGKGIVPTTDNFGVLGQLPTHPELLDYLAIQFMQEQWSTKQLIRRIVLSRTYGMSTQNSPEVESADPKNQYWHSARIKRIDAESIRDSMMQIAGKLDRKMFGPSVQTYLTEFMQGRGRPQSGPMHGNWRRSVYLEVRRNFMNPMMIVFDSPVPLSTTGNRNQSNVPAQSLTLLNDPLMNEIANQWAGDLLKRFPGNGAEISESRIQEMYIQALGRKPLPEEQERILAFLDNQQPEVEQWQALAHALFNLKEFIYLK